jgi:hypothetical protein
MGLHAATNSCHCKQAAVPQQAPGRSVVLVVVVMVTAACVLLTLQQVFKQGGFGAPQQQASCCCGPYAHPFPWQLFKWSCPSVVCCRAGSRCCFTASAVHPCGMVQLCSVWPLPRVPACLRETAAGRCVVSALCSRVGGVHAGKASWFHCSDFLNPAACMTEVSALPMNSIIPDIYDEQQDPAKL